jgi:hypothetical protein
LRKWQSFYVTKEDQEVINFIHKKLKGSVSYAIKEALSRYAKICGWKERKIEDQMESRDQKDRG